MKPDPSPKETIINKRVKLKTRLYLGPSGARFVEAGSIGTIVKDNMIGMEVEFGSAGKRFKFAYIPDNPTVIGVGDLELIVDDPSVIATGDPDDTTDDPPLPQTNHGG